MTLADLKAREDLKDEVQAEMGVASSVQLDWVELAARDAQQHPEWSHQHGEWEKVKYEDASGLSSHLEGWSWHDDVGPHQPEAQNDSDWYRSRT